jgi:hypothetical protein
MSRTTKKKAAGSAKKPIYFECYLTSSPQQTRMDKPMKPVIFEQNPRNIPRVLPMNPYNNRTAVQSRKPQTPKVLQTTPLVYNDFVFLNEIEEGSIQNTDFRNALIYLIHDTNIEKCKVNQDNNQVLKYSTNTKKFQLNISQASRSRPSNCFLVNIYNIGVALEKNKKKFKLSQTQSKRFDKIVNEMKSVTSEHGRKKNLNYFQNLINPVISETSSHSSATTQRTGKSKTSSSKNNLDKYKK